MTKPITTATAAPVAETSTAAPASPKPEVTKASSKAAEFKKVTASLGSLETGKSKTLHPMKSLKRDGIGLGDPAGEWTVKGAVFAGKVAAKVAIMGKDLGPTLAKGVAALPGNIVTGKAAGVIYDGLGLKKGTVGHTVATTATGIVLGEVAAAATPVISSAVAGSAAAAGSGAVAATGGLAAMANAAIASAGVGLALAIGPAIEYLPTLITGRTASDHIAEEVGRTMDGCTPVKDRPGFAFCPDE